MLYVQRAGVGPLPLQGTTYPERSYQMATFPVKVVCPCGCNHSWDLEVSSPSKVTSTRPGQETLTGKVWLLCDTLSGSLGRRATRKEVTVAGALAGLNPATVSTQYQKWLTSVGHTLPVAAPTVAAPVQVVTQ